LTLIFISTCLNVLIDPPRHATGPESFPGRVDPISCPYLDAFEIIEIGYADLCSDGKVLYAAEMPWWSKTSPLAVFFHEAPRRTLMDPRGFIRVQPSGQKSNTALCSNSLLKKSFSSLL
jgi:hypothetical protein